MIMHLVFILEWFIFLTTTEKASGIETYLFCKFKEKSIK